MPERLYYPQLDGLRFLAFFLVFLHHLPPAKTITSHILVWKILAPIQAFGWMGVDIFLCLSGFLITWLLLVESERTENISIGKFYIRRALRIWPLYFLFILVGFWILPLTGLFEPQFGAPDHMWDIEYHLLPFTFLLGNWSIGIFGYTKSVVLSHLWTISLEEHFYLVWPLLLKFLRNNCRRLVLVVCAIWLASAAARFFLWLQGVPHPFIWASSLTRLDSFLVGTLIALAYNSSLDRHLRRFKSIYFLVGLLLFVWVANYPNVIFTSGHIHWQYPAVALGAGALVLAAIYNRFWGWLFSRPLLVPLGKISYGLYVYHLAAIQLAGKVVLSYSVRPVWMWLVLFFLALGITILLASASYQLYEKRWLRLKERFTIVQSRPV